MKRILILIYLFAGVLYLQAQTFTVEYNFGYGTFSMSDMKDALSNYKQISMIKGIETTDNFPAHFTHDARVGMLLGEKHHMGLLFAYQNTAGQNHLADYSGEIKFRIRNKGYKFGAFYRYLFIESGKFTPFVEGSFGLISCKSDMMEYIKIEGSGVQKEEYDLSGLNLFFQPAIGALYRLHEKVGIQATIGYEIDFDKNMHVKGDKSQKTINTDWSGIRASAGIILFL